MSNTLYHLTNEFLEVVSQLEELELDQETLSDTLEALQMPLEQKAENVIKYVRSLEALADAKKLEAKRLSEAASADLKKAENLLTYLDTNLKRANIKNLQAGVFELKYKKGSEVVEVDSLQMPRNIIDKDGNEVFLKWVEEVPKHLGKPELKKLIKGGLEIPGVQVVRNPDKLEVK